MLGAGLVLGLVLIHCPSSSQAVTLAALVAALPLAGYLAVRRRNADPATLPPLAAIGAVCALVALYLLWVAPALTFPADILMWAKATSSTTCSSGAGRPLYGPPADNDSINYPPAAPLLSGLLAQLAGWPDSLAVLRVLQLGQALLAALVAASCCRRLVHWPVTSRGREPGMPACRRPCSWWRPIP